MGDLANQKWLCWVACAGSVFLILANPVSANSVLTYAAGISNYDGGVATFGFASNPRAAQAVFEPLAGGQLKITLANSSTADLNVPEEILTALFFDMDGDLSPNPENALLAPGSVVYKGSTLINVPDGDVSGEWAYAKNILTLPAAYCISSVGLDDLIGPKDRFDTSMNLYGPASPNGMEYGIAGTGDDPSTGNGGVEKNPLIHSSVVFTFDGLPADFAIGSISNVYFHYGTSFTPLDDNPPQPPPSVPEPATFMAVLLALTGLGGYARRRGIRT